MDKTIQNIAVLTSGGDAPGMNAALRSPGQGQPRLVLEHLSQAACALARVSDGHDPGTGLCLSAVYCSYRIRAPGHFRQRRCHGPY